MDWTPKMISVLKRIARDPNLRWKDAAKTLRLSVGAVKRYAARHGIRKVTPHMAKKAKAARRLAKSTN